MARVIAAVREAAHQVTETEPGPETEAETDREPETGGRSPPRTGAEAPGGRAPAPPARLNRRAGSAPLIDPTPDDTDAGLGRAR